MSPSPKAAALKFLLDENVDIRLTTFLQKKGFSVSVVPKGLKNGKVATLVLKGKRVLLTNDTDFANPLLFPPSKFPGIVIFRIHPPDFPKLISAIEKLLTKVPRQQVHGKVFLLEETGITIIE